MKKKLFLLVVLSILLTCQAFAKMTSIDVNYGDGWQKIVCTDPAGNESNSSTRNHISTVDKKFFESSLGSNDNTMEGLAIIDQGNNICEAADNVKSNVFLNVDMSESPSIVLIGMGIAIAIIRKWRKLLPTAKE